MPRVEIPITVISSVDGKPVSGASVRLMHRYDNSFATWYSAETGGTASTALMTTNSSGRVDAWAERGAYSLRVTGSRLTSYTESWDAVPASDLSLDGTWLGSGIDASKINTGTLPALQVATGSSLRIVHSVVVNNPSQMASGSDYVLASGSIVHNGRGLYGLFYCIGKIINSGPQNPQVNLVFNPSPPESSSWRSLGFSTATNNEYIEFFTFTYLGSVPLLGAGSLPYNLVVTPDIFNQGAFKTHGLSLYIFER